MKATGIVRRIDDLGRIVIPKEIRRTMRIREGDPLEIFTDNEGDVIFKKYSPVGEMAGFFVQYAEVLSKTGGLPVIITDRDHIVAVAGLPKSKFLEQRISAQLEELIEQRRSYSYENNEKKLFPCEDMDRNILVAATINSSGDANGAIMFLDSEPGTKVTQTEIKLISTAALFLARQMDE